MTIYKNNVIIQKKKANEKDKRQRNTTNKINVKSQILSMKDNRQIQKRRQTTEDKG